MRATDDVHRQTGYHAIRAGVAARRLTLPSLVTIPDLKKGKHSFLHGSRLRFVAVDAELEEDGGIFGHGSERSNKPRQVLQKVFLFNRVEQNLWRSARSKGGLQQSFLTPMP